jgi:hypothetical protein
LEIIQSCILRSQSSSRSRPKAGNPADLAGNIHQAVAQAIHTDEPFINQPENQFGLAAPAGGVAVGVGLYIVEQPFFSRLSNMGEGTSLTCIPVNQSNPST